MWGDDWGDSWRNSSGGDWVSDTSSQVDTKKKNKYNNGQHVVESIKQEQKCEFTVNQCPLIEYVKEASESGVYNEELWLKILYKNEHIDFHSTDFAVMNIALKVLSAIKPKKNKNISELQQKTCNLCNAMRNLVIR